MRYGNITAAFNYFNPLGTLVSTMLNACRCQLFGDRPSPDGAVNSSSLPFVEASSHLPCCCCTCSHTASITATGGHIMAPGSQGLPCMAQVDQESSCTRREQVSLRGDERSRVSELEQEVARLRCQLAQLVRAATEDKGTCCSFCFCLR